MKRRLPFHRLIPLGASCLLHVALVGVAVALGLEIAVSKEPRVLLAELVPADSRLDDAPRPLIKAAPPRPPAFAPPKPLTTARTETPRLEMPAEPVRPRETVETPPSVKQEPPETNATPAPALSAAPSSPDAVPASGVSPAFAAISDVGVAAEPARRGGHTVDSPKSMGSTAMATPTDITQAAIPRGGYQVRPTYPGTARRLGIQGTTTLRIYVAVNGVVSDVLIEQSAGHPDLDHAAADAVKRWKFEPARRGTQPVGMWVLLPVEFRLK